MKLTRRGEVILALGLAALALFALMGIYKVSISTHYTDHGYCWGTFEKCYGEGEGKR